MASEEPVRMLESEPRDFELTELDGPEEELLGRYLPIGDVAKSIGVNPSVLRFWEQEFPQLRPRQKEAIAAITARKTWRLSARFSTCSMKSTTQFWVPETKSMSFKSKIR